jgi:tryptophan-rich sensory protein
VFIRAVLPHEWYPRAVLKVVDDYANILRDDLVRGVPAWFAGLVWMELIVQIPLSVLLLWAYHTKSNVLRPAVLVYAAHVLTTMAPIFFHFNESLKAPHKWCVMSIYSPWAVILVSEQKNVEAIKKIR